MKTNKRMRNVLSILLTFCIVLSYLPTTAFATTCQHTPGEPVVDTIPPGCYDEGYVVTTVDCTKCFERLVEKFEPIPAAGHTPGETQVERVEPGCDYDGGIYTWVDCSVCGERISYQEESIPATGHSPGEENCEALQDPTCTEDGFAQCLIWCTECGAELLNEERPIPATGHSYVPEGNPPTCTEAGYTTYTCSICGDSYTDDEVDITGHGFTNGFTYSDNGDGTHEVYCNDCENVVINADCTEFNADHKCTECGGVEQLTITFMNGEEEEWASQTCSYGGTLGIGGMPVPEAPSGMVFDGWYTKDNVFVYHGMTVTTGLVAYATWKESCAIIWISDGETHAVTFGKLGDTVTPPEDPTKKDYHFKGWDTEIPETFPEKNLTITAVWEACSGGRATCTQKAVCAGCGEEYGELAHTGTKSYTVNTAETGKQHDTTWSCCGTTVAEPHSAESSGNCVCGFNPISSVTIIGDTELNYSESGYLEVSFVLVDGYTADETSFAWSDHTNAEGTFLEELDAGEYTYACTVTVDGYRMTGSATVTVAPIEPEYIDPAAVIGLSYTGIAQNLISVGEVADGQGTMKYSLSMDGAYTADIPTGTSAGEYTVYYKIDGTAPNYGCTDILGTISVTIAPAIPTITWSEISATASYTGSVPTIPLPQVTLVNSETYDGEIIYSYTGTSGGEEVSGTGLPTNAGTYTIAASVAASGNYTAVTSTNTLELTINMADPTYTVPIGLTAVYGETLADVELPDGFSWMDSSLSVGDMGSNTFSVTYTPGDTTNYNVVTDIQVSVSVKAEAASIVTAPTAKSGLSYNGSAQALITAGSSNDGSIMYKLGEDGTYSDTIPTAENAGSYTIYYYVKGDSDHADSAVQKIEATIGQLDITGKTVDIILADTLTYNGAEQTIAVSSAKLGDLTVAYTLSGNAGTNAGSYVLTLTGSGNFKGSVTKEWGIAQKPVTVTAKDQTIIYGDAISGTETMTVGLVDGHSVSMTLTPSTANVTVTGTIIPSAAVITADGTDVTANYNVSYTSGRLVIEPDTSKIDALTTDNVTSANEEDIKAVQAMLASAETDGIDQATAARWAAITANCEALVDVIDAARKAANTENIEKVLDVTAESVKPEDKEALTDAKADFEKALENNNGNYTEEEKQAIQNEIQRIEDAMVALENVEDVTKIIAQLPENVEPNDEETAEKISDAKKSYDELTDHEKTIVDEAIKEKLNGLLAALTAYDIIMGDGGEWTMGSTYGLSFTANGPFSKFAGIKVDGEEVASTGYIAEGGSTITLKQFFLKKLSIGDHTITVLYTDGKTSGAFKILAQSATPATGDDSDLMLWAGILCVSTLGLVILLADRKGRKATR